MYPPTRSLTPYEESVESDALGINFTSITLPGLFSSGSSGHIVSTVPQGISRQIWWLRFFESRPTRADGQCGRARP